MRTNGERQPEEILADIEHTRTEMDATLSAIESRLTPGQLMDQGIDYLRHSGGREFLSNLGGSVKRNPLPVALVGIGLAWLMMGGRGRGYMESEPVPTGDVTGGWSESATAAGARLEEQAGAARERLGGAVSSAKERLSGAASGTRERMSGAAAAARERFESARGRAQQLGHSARAQVDRARGGYERMAREQPLALGAIGLAIGALVAAAVPRTRHEDELMGEASDQVADRARQLAEEGAEAAQRVVRKAGEAGSEEARRQTSQWAPGQGEPAREPMPGGASLATGTPAGDATPG